MSNFSELISDVLSEKGKTFKDLENDGIISKRTFYQYKTFTPFLPTILNIAYYLEVSLDYLSGKSQENKFKKYKSNQNNFYENLVKELKILNISQSKLAKELKIGRPNFQYWKNGSLPKFYMLIEIASYLNCDIDDLLDTE